MAVSARTDLTEGSVSARLIRYAVPIMAASILQSLYGVADMLIVSRFLGSAGASAVSNSGQITRIVTQIAIGIATGGGILAGQYFGNKDKENLEYAIGSFFTLFAGIGTVSTVVFFVCSRFFLSALKAPAPEESLAYLQICSCGFLFVFGYNALAAILRAVGNSGKPLHFIIASTVTNVVLDMIFIGVFKWGTAGAAAATVAAQALSFGLALHYLTRQKEIFSFEKKYFKMQAGKVLIILKLGIPCAVQMSIAGLSWLTVTRLVNDYGVALSAANGISTKIKDFSMQLISSLTTGAAAMIAQNLGASLYDRAKKTLYSAMRIALLTSVITVIVVEIFAPQLVALFISDPEVSGPAVLNLRIEIVSQLFYAIFLIYHSLMIGAGHTLCVLFSSFVNCVLVRIPLSIFMNGLWGPVGIFIACAIAPVSSVPVGFIYEKLGRWKTSIAAKT